jgi:hypothetical protein
LARHATVEAYRDDGPIRPEVFDQAARDLRYAAATCLLHGDADGARLVEAWAADVDETAELARLLIPKAVAA